MTGVSVPTAPANVRSWGENGPDADMPLRSSLTHTRHKPGGKGGR